MDYEEFSREEVRAAFREAAREQEAAEAKLQADNARLRAALEKIAGQNCICWEWDEHDCPHNIAREALEGK